MNNAAIILCAGKGTRMNDDSQNKVCFDCAGVPVIKRILHNMRLGGIRLFVIVVGHLPESVMRCLDGEEGVIYAYQKEQKGTGHAALCGLKALKDIGYTGSAVISMGDKIIAPQVISELLSKKEGAVWGVQPVNNNYHGGRVVMQGGKPCGVVELPDAVLMSLADKEESQYDAEIARYRLNEKKAARIRAAAAKQKPCGTRLLAGKLFTAQQILDSPYANGGLYCFDVKKVVTALSTCNAQNAQGEIYLTDALEWFATHDSVTIYEIKSARDMLTYSSKSELRAMSMHFMMTASALLHDIEIGAYDAVFSELYGSAGEKSRYIQLLNAFIARYGDKKLLITRAPGRVNLMGRHIDHRGGGINVMAINRDTLFAVAPRDDDQVNISNVDAAYPDRSFDIGSLMPKGKYAAWLDYLNAPETKSALEQSRGDWANYVKSAVARVQLDTDLPLCGMDMIASGNIPVAAGLSSSSSIVVAVMEAVTSLNCLNYTDSAFVNLCGEGEWFVGSRGGAGDHAAMKCAKKGSVIHLRFKPFGISETVPFSDEYAVIVANSMIKAKKSEGSKDIFNARVAAYEVSFMILKRLFPTLNLAEFRDLAAIRPYSKIYTILKSLPETMTRSGIKALLPEYANELERLFATHQDPVVYALRAVTLYGISECVRSEAFMELLKKGDYAGLGQMMKISHEGDRIEERQVSDAFLDQLIAEDADVALQYGSYGCSTRQIDALCDLLNETPGVLGSELVGAGLGGCVVALVQKDRAQDVISRIGAEYYDKYAYERSAAVFTSSPGSRAIY